MLALATYEPHFRVLREDVFARYKMTLWSRSSRMRAGGKEANDTKLAFGEKLEGIARIENALVPLYLDRGSNLSEPRQLHTDMAY